MSAYDADLSQRILFAITTFPKIRREYVLLENLRLVYKEINENHKKELKLLNAINQNDKLHSLALNCSKLSYYQRLLPYLNEYAINLLNTPIISFNYLKDLTIEEVHSLLFETQVQTLPEASTLAQLKYNLTKQSSCFNEYLCKLDNEPKPTPGSVLNKFKQITPELALEIFGPDYKKSLKDINKSGKRFSISITPKTPVNVQHNSDNNQNLDNQDSTKLKASSIIDYSVTHRGTISKIQEAEFIDAICKNIFSKNYRAETSPRSNQLSNDNHNFNSVATINIDNVVSPISFFNSNQSPHLAQTEDDDPFNIKPEDLNANTTDIVRGNVRK